MSVTAITRDQVENVNIVRLVSTDTLAEVSADGYLTAQNDNITALNSGIWDWQASDLIAVFASDGHQFFEFDGDDFTTLVQLAGGNGAVTLPVTNNNFAVFDGTLGGLKDAGYLPSDATKTRVVMATAATVADHIMVSTDTTGTAGNKTGVAINDGGLQAGRSGVAGSLYGFAASATTGKFGILPVANSGDFTVSVSNAAHAQSTVYSIADIGASTGGLVSSTSPIRMKAVAGAAAAGGAADQSFTDAFCTSGSNVVGNWNTQANAASVLKIVPGNGSFVVTSSADAGVGTFNYVITKP